MHPAKLTIAICFLLLAIACPISQRSWSEDKEKPAYEPTANYESRDIEGWTVLVNKRLLNEKQELGDKAIRLLALQLYQIKTLVPQRQVVELQKIKIWLDDDPRNQIHYHPERQWLVDNGFNPDRAKAVDIGVADQFVNVYREQPFVVLHELAHAYHDQVLGFEDERIKHVYELAVAGKEYESVLKIQEHKGRHYALTDHKEFFAEATESFLGTNDFYPFVRSELKEHDLQAYELLQEIWLTEVKEPSSQVRKKFKLDPYYQKYVSAGGLPIVSSDKVADEALLEAAYLINRMLAGRGDIRGAMIDNKTRFAVMAFDEFTTDVPEHATLQPKKYWDRRARGLGATAERPAVSCGEENLLAYPGDPYHTENILIHEFAHAMHQMGLNTVDKEFDERLRMIYEQAMNEGLWKDKYAATNRDEYWAEGVQSYLDTNREDDHDHNHVNTREELKEYDPRLFELIDGVFQQNPWRYTHPSQRLQLAHLRTVESDNIPSFQWPKRLEAEGKSQKAKR